MSKLTSDFVNKSTLHINEQQVTVVIGLLHYMTVILQGCLLSYKQYLLAAGFSYELNRNVEW